MAIEDSGLTGTNLIRIYDELRAVERGLNGFIGMVCQGDRKKISLNVEDFYFAINPLQEKISDVNALLNKTRKRMDRLPEQIPRRSAIG